MFMGQEVWRKAFGALGPDEAAGVAITSDGRILAAGSTGSFGNGSSDAYVICVDSSGDLLWSTTIGSPQVDRAMALAVLEDGSYVVVGFSNGGGNGGYDGWLVKMDGTTNVQWERYFGGMGWDMLYDIHVDGDGSMLLAGTTSSSGAGSSDGWLIKVDAEGEQQWSRTFGGVGEDELRSVQPTNDGGAVVAGWSTSQETRRDVFVAKVTDDGGEQWSRDYRTDSAEYACDVVQTMDGGYSVVGTTHYYEDFNEHWHLRLSAGGDSLWSRHWGQIGIQEPAAHVEMPDGRFVTIGYSTTSGEGGKEMFLLRSTASGDFNGQFTYGGVDDEMATSFVVVPDGFILAGKTNTFGAGSWDVALVRTDTAGGPLVQAFGEEFDPVNIENHDRPGSLGIAPNPARTSFRLLDGLINEHVILLDVHGREVRRWSSPEIDYAIDGLSSGIYSVVVASAQGKRRSCPLVIIGH